MQKPKLFITRYIPEEAIKRLEEVFEVEIFPENRAITHEELKEKVKDIDALICLLTDNIDHEIIEAASNLKCISVYAVGYNNIDVETATKHGIVICNTPGVLTETTADLAWALIMSCARRIVEADCFVREGKFQGWEPMLMLGNDIFGKTLGIIGMGRIGRAVANRALGFDMKVIYYDPQVDPESLPSDYVSVDLTTLCQNSDFISIHTPLTPETRHLIGEKEFNLMKPTAILINTARGPIIDEQTLISALKEHKIAGAGLDVYENEPVIPEELIKLSNVILLPHIGSASYETRTKMALLAAENAIAVIEGKNPPARVN
ncbi:MAG TPA: D-glycerate dehydrogenase [Candidatus Syntrophosphaera thermopropionivorans]|nr:D-glycerate dehydrogenase [Candidatus Syntrophosphaera sp.]HNU97114.1 D-glycerate dehydrogenase [Candidatus Syntrophosphaera thermopropionivorans]